MFLVGRSLFHINAAYRRRQLLNDVYSMVELAKIQNLFIQIPRNIYVCVYAKRNFQKKIL